MVFLLYSEERGTTIMALPSTIYRLQLHISNVDRGIYETLQTTVARHPSETEERLVARLLAAAVFYEPELSFTKGLSATDEPDLWVKGGDGSVLFWVEVGLPAAERIVKASRHSEKIALLAFGKAMANWEQQHLPKLRKLDNLVLMSVEQDFIGSLAGQLERTIEWSVTITEGTLYLTTGHVTRQTALDFKLGGYI